MVWEVLNDLDASARTKDINECTEAFNQSQLQTMDTKATLIKHLTFLVEDLQAKYGNKGALKLESK
jgi:hypothetical protein